MRRCLISVSKPKNEKISKLTKIFPKNKPSNKNAGHLRNQSDLSEELSGQLSTRTCREKNQLQSNQHLVSL